MKIGFVLDDSLDSTDGVQQYVLSLGAWFSAKGHEVHYLVGQTKRSDLPYIHSLSKNMTVRFNGNKMTMPLPSKSSAIKLLLEREAFDVLHIQMPYSPFMGGKVIRFAPARTALIGTFHILPRGKIAHTGSKALHLAQKRTIRRFDKLLSVSKPAQEFAEQLGLKTSVIPNMVDMAAFQTPNRPANKVPTIVFLGRLVERKGCLQLLRSIDRLQDKKSIPKFKVIIGGTGPQEKSLRDWVYAHKLEKVVSFKGFIPESEKAAFLAQADIAVFPSLGGESFGIVLLEAMAAGSRVVLAGNNPGYSSVLEPIQKSLFNPFDVADMALKIETILTDKKQAASIHAAQEQLVQQYDVNIIGQKLSNEYKTLVAKRNK